MKKENTKKPLKNYILLLSAFVITIFSAWYIFNMYTDYIFEKDHTLSNYISEISYDELSNYVIDNPNTIVYLSSRDNINHVDFEKSFIDYIKENNLKSSIVYFDTKKIAINDLITIKATYFKENLSEVNLDTFPNLIIFENGKIVDLLYKNHEQIDLDHVKKMIEKYEEEDA